MQPIFKPLKKTKVCRKSTNIIKTKMQPIIKPKKKTIVYRKSAHIIKPKCNQFSNLKKKPFKLVKWHNFKNH